MPRTILDEYRPNPKAVSKLIERYIKIERHISVGEALDRAGYSRTMYYNRQKAPAEFTLAELRRWGKALNIPREEMAEALAEAIRY